MQTIARANRVTDHLINNKPKKNGLIVDYYNVFRNLKKAFAPYGGGSSISGGGSGKDSPVQEKEQLFVLLKDSVNEWEQYCKSIDVGLQKIADSGVVFNKLALFDE